MKSLNAGSASGTREPKPTTHAVPRRPEPAHRGVVRSRRVPDTHDPQHAGHDQAHRAAGRYVYGALARRHPAILPRSKRPVGGKRILPIEILSWREVSLSIVSEVADGGFCRAPS